MNFLQKTLAGLLAGFAVLVMAAVLAGAHDDVPKIKKCEAVGAKWLPRDRVCVRTIEVAP